MKFVTKLALITALAGAAFAADAATLSSPSPRVATYAVLNNGFTIRHLRSEVLGDNTRLYVAAESGYVDVPTSSIVRLEQEEPAPAPPNPAVPPAPPKSVPELAADAGTRHHIDPDFIASVIRAESSGNPRAVSPVGARGLMQLMPGTAAQLGVRDSFDPAANVDGGTRYLRQLLVQYHGDAARALAAYNAGPHRVEQYGGVPPYRETRAYVGRVIREYNRRKIAQDPSLARAARAPARRSAASK